MRKVSRRPEWRDENWRVRQFVDADDHDAYFSEVSTPLKLYVKTWCPWCVRAKDYLDDSGYSYEEIDVERSREGYAEMVQLSGQHYTPTLLAKGKILPDFGPDELEVFLKEHSITP